MVVVGDRVEFAYAGVRGLDHGEQVLARRGVSEGAISSDGREAGAVALRRAVVESELARLILMLRDAADIDGHGDARGIHTPDLFRNPSEGHGAGVARMRRTQGDGPDCWGFVTTKAGLRWLALNRAG